MVMKVKPIADVLPAMLESHCCCLFGGNRGGHRVEEFTGGPAHIAPTFSFNGTVWMPEARSRGMTMSRFLDTAEEWNDVWVLFVEDDVLPDPWGAITYAIDLCDQGPGDPPSRKNVRYEYRNFVWWWRFLRRKAVRPPDTNRRLYCSEFWAKYLQHARVQVATNQITPLEGAWFRVFRPTYYQVKVKPDGKPRELRLFNTWDPAVPLPDVPSICF